MSDSLLGEVRIDLLKRLERRGVPGDTAEQLLTVLDFSAWERHGRPVAPHLNLRRVWGTSPYGQHARDRHPSAIRAVRPPRGFVKRTEGTR